MKYLALAAGILLSIWTNAQCRGIEVEEVENSGYVKGKTYRVYVQMEHDSDQVNMVFGDEQHPMEILSNKPFYQNEFGGALANNVNRKLSREKKELAFDSWFTIGATDNYENNTTNFLLDLAAFEKEGASVRTNNGAWFCTPGYGQARAGKARRVLIMQLTTEGELNLRFSLMGRTANNQVWYAYDQRYSKK